MTSQATRRLLSVLLRKIEGFEQKNNAIVIGATNRKIDLDDVILSFFSFPLLLPFFSFPPLLPTSLYIYIYIYIGFGESI